MWTAFVSLNFPPRRIRHIADLPEEIPDARVRPDPVVGSFANPKQVQIAREYVGYIDKLEAGQMGRLRPAEGKAKDISLDVGNGHVYWTEQSPTNKIMRANLDGTMPELFLWTGSGTFGIEFYGGASSLNHGGNSPLIVWTEDNNKLIKSASPDGTNVQTVVAGLNAAPKYITVGPY